MKRLVFLLLIAFGSVLYGQQVLDEIVAVVDDQVILESELEFNTMMFAAKNKLNPKNPELKRQVLNDMIREKLLQAQAKLDSIQVAEEQVDQQLDSQISYYVRQYGSRDRLEQAYGMSIEKIKREMRENVRKQIMAQMLQQKKFGSVEVTRRDVRDFYETYKDSLGLIPQRYKVAHIFINPKATERLRKKAKNLAESLLDSLNKGADFSELAREYSDDPGSASKGGDLGFVERGKFYSEFEAAAFSLAPGEISRVVKTPAGYHIIKLLERRGNQIHCKHILISVKRDEQAELNSIKFLNNVRDSILQGYHSFEYFAKKYSDDEDTAPYGGVLGTFEMGQMDEAIKKAVKDLEEGEISYPKRLDLDDRNFGYHIVKLVEVIPEHKPTLEKDYNELERLAEYRKRERLYKEWIKELKDKIYWEIRL
jgi:peptidyl-prolyl cis-trans isomerase SurA